MNATHIAVPAHLAGTFTAWIDEMVWIAPDNILQECLAVRRAVAGKAAFAVTPPELGLLAAYFDYLCDRDSDAAIADRPALHELVAVLSAED